MGPRYFVDDRIWPLKQRGYSLRHVARVESGSPATGSKAIHDQELEDLMDQTFAN
jgi:2-oxoglutarate dehydrogenase E1 component